MPVEHPNPRMSSSNNPQTQSCFRERTLRKPSRQGQISIAPIVEQETEGMLDFADLVEGI
jgi:hypothetical protein